MKCNNCGVNFDGNICPSCGSENNTAKGSPVKRRNYFYNKPWFWLIILIVSVVSIAILGKINANVESDTAPYSVVTESTDDLSEDISN